MEQQQGCLHSFIHCNVSQVGIILICRAEAWTMTDQATGQNFMLFKCIIKDFMYQVEQFHNKCCSHRTIRAGRHWEIIKHNFQVCLVMLPPLARPCLSACYSASDNIPPRHGWRYLRGRHHISWLHQVCTDSEVLTLLSWKAVAVVSGHVHCIMMINVTIT